MRSSVSAYEDELEFRAAPAGWRAARTGGGMMKATTAMLLLPLALMVSRTLPASAAEAEDHDITCEIDLNELTDADSQNIPSQFRNQSFLTPVKPELGDFATKKCTQSAPDQTIQIRCVRVVENWPNAPSFTTKTFKDNHLCTVTFVPECGDTPTGAIPADNQTFKISPSADGKSAVLDLFCVRNKR
jgi:hypothetical protein